MMNAVLVMVYSLLGGLYLLDGPFFTHAEVMVSGKSKHQIGSSRALLANPSTCSLGKYKVPTIEDSRWHDKQTLYSRATLPSISSEISTGSEYRWAVDLTRGKKGGAWYHQQLLAISSIACEERHSNSKQRFVLENDYRAFRMMNGSCVRAAPPYVGYCEAVPNCYWGEVSAPWLDPSEGGDGGALDTNITLNAFSSNPDSISTRDIDGSTVDVHADERVNRTTRYTPETLQDAYLVRNSYYHEFVWFLVPGFLPGALIVMVWWLIVLGRSFKVHKCAIFFTCLKPLIHRLKQKIPATFLTDLGRSDGPVPGAALAKGGYSPQEEKRFSKRFWGLSLILLVFTLLGDSLDDTARSSLKTSYSQAKDSATMVSSYASEMQALLQAIEVAGAPAEVAAKEALRNSTGVWGASDKAIRMVQAYLDLYYDAAYLPSTMDSRFNEIIRLLNSTTRGVVLGLEAPLRSLQVNVVGTTDEVATRTSLAHDTLQALVEVPPAVQLELDQFEARLFEASSARSTLVDAMEICIYVILIMGAVGWLGTVVPLSRATSTKFRPLLRYTAALALLCSGVVMWVMSWTFLLAVAVGDSCRFAGAVRSDWGSFVNSQAASTLSSCFAVEDLFQSLGLVDVMGWAEPFGNMMGSVRWLNAGNPLSHIPFWADVVENELKSEISRNTPRLLHQALRLRTYPAADEDAFKGGCTYNDVYGGRLVSKPWESNAASNKGPLRLTPWPPYESYGRQGSETGEEYMRRLYNWTVCEEYEEGYNEALVSAWVAYSNRTELFENMATDWYNSMGVSETGEVVMVERSVSPEFRALGFDRSVQDYFRELNEHTVAAKEALMSVGSGGAVGIYRDTGVRFQCYSQCGWMLGVYKEAQQELCTSGLGALVHLTWVTFLLMVALGGLIHASLRCHRHLRAGSRPADRRKRVTNTSDSISRRSTKRSILTADRVSRLEMSSRRSVSSYNNSYSVEEGYEDSWSGEEGYERSSLIERNDHRY